MTQKRVLVVDDDDLFRRSLQKELNNMGYAVRSAESATKALAEVRLFLPDVVLLDIRLPDQDGVGLLRGIKETDPSLEVIMLTAYGSIDSAVNSMQMGAYHYLVKPARLAEVDALIKKAYEKRMLQVENNALKRKLRDRPDSETIIGSSPRLKELLDLSDRIAPTDHTVLIQGESGTGKELIAHRIHRLSNRSRSAFVLVDCASLHRSLLESELFGHEKGAFTGALGIKHGLLEAAHTGTLFIDEVGALESDLQARFLRMLETQQYRRLGGTETRKSDVRIIAATNIDLSEAVHQGKFREDLFFRLSVIVLSVPPLRDRKEDIPLLAAHFLRSSRMSNRPKALSPQALEELCRYSWPGNVRQLRNVMERASLLCEGDMIEPWDLRIYIRGSDRIVPRLLRDDDLITLRELQSRYIKFVLEKVHGHQLKAADILGIDPKTIYRALRKQNE